MGRAGRAVDVGLMMSSLKIDTYSAAPVGRGWRACIAHHLRTHKGGGGSRSAYIAGRAPAALLGSLSLPNFVALKQMARLADPDADVDGGPLFRPM